MHIFRWTVSLFCGHLLFSYFRYVAWIHIEVPLWLLLVHVCSGISPKFVLSVKENVYSPCWPKEYLNNSTDSLKASVFISSKVTGLIDSAGKSSRQLEVPPERPRETQLSPAYIMSAFLCVKGGKMKWKPTRTALKSHKVWILHVLLFPGTIGVFQESTVSTLVYSPLNNVC